MMTPGNSLTLTQLLRLSFGETVRWLSPAARDVSIAWVATDPTEVREDDLLLLPISDFQPEMVNEVIERGAAAILLLGEVPTPIPQISTAIPVAAVPGHSDLRTIEQLILTMLVNQRAAVMERGVRIHTQLSHLAAEGEGLNTLALAMAEISGRGVLVQDKRLQILAHYPSSTLTAIWEDVLDHLRRPEALPESLRDRKRAGQQNSLLTQSIPGGLVRFITTITVGEIARGYLSLIGLSGELDALDQLVIEQGALICAVEMARAKAVRETEKRLKGDLLTALLEDDLSPRDAHLWVQAMGLDLSQAHVALRFAWDASAPPSRRRLETMVNGEVARLGLATIVNPMGAEVVCFCEIPPSSARPVSILEFAATVARQAYLEHPQSPVRCGLGRPALDLNEWRASFRQAGQALEMARRFGETAPLYYPDLSVYRLLLQIEHSPELSAFQEEILGPLLAHDNASELLRTLEAYFDHNGNLSQTAEALYVHRNTLLYRMERIAAITGLDLNDSMTRLSIQLALHIQRMTGSKYI